MNNFPTASTGGNGAGNLGRRSPNDKKSPFWRAKRLMGQHLKENVKSFIIAVYRHYYQTIPLVKTQPSLGGAGAVMRKEKLQFPLPASDKRYCLPSLSSPRSNVLAFIVYGHIHGTESSFKIELGAMSTHISLESEARVL